MAMTGPRQGGIMAEINVTPFVDVMLVLLIIFMVTAPLMTTGVELDLPRAEAQSLAAENQLVLSMTATEQIFLSDGSGNDREIPLAELPAKLKAISEANPNRPVFVRADGALRYEKVLQLLDLAKNAGIVKVGLVTQPGSAEP
jgi:biopolymer transport protein TolR